MIASLFGHEFGFPASSSGIRVSLWAVSAVAVLLSMNKKGMLSYHVRRGGCGRKEGHHDYKHG